MTVVKPIKTGRNSSVSIVGIAAEYPPFTKGPEFMDELARRHSDATPVLEKSLEINRKSQIDTRYSVLGPDHEHWHQPNVPTISECEALFKQYGIPLAAEASTKAIKDWGGLPSDITHVVAVTCTSTSNPGFDSLLSRKLGLRYNVRRVLLHGVGCGGGLAAIRVAQEMLLGAMHQKVPARALIVSCELPTIFSRTEINAMNQNQEVNVALALFGDCSAALVLSNGIGAKQEERLPIWNVLNCQTTHLEGSEGLGEYNVHPNGYLAKIDKKIPLVIGQSIQGGFTSLITSTPALASRLSNYDPGNYDWAFHPGGYAFLLAAQSVLGLTPYHLRKSYEAYRDGGNTVSSTVISIMNRLKKESESEGTDLEVQREEVDQEKLKPRKRADHVIAVAFGHGLTMEMAVLAKPCLGNKDA